MFVPLYLSYSSAFPIELWTWSNNIGDLCAMYDICFQPNWLDVIFWDILTQLTELLCGFPDYPKGTTKMYARRSWTCAIKKLRIPVEPNEIERVNRLGRPGGNPRQILVKFATYGTRASVFKAKAVLRPGGRHPHAPWTLTMTMTMKRHLLPKLYKENQSIIQVHNST